MADPSVRLLASGLAFPESPVAEPAGTVLVSEMAAGRITRVHQDGTCDTVAETGGGPNGIGALGDGTLVVCQNGGSSWGTGRWPIDAPGAVELLRPVGPPPRPVAPQLQLVESGGVVRTLATEFTAIDGTRRGLVRPSDICVDAAGGFYVTDGGTTRGRERTLTGLLYGTPDGDLTEVLYPMEMPNGVALSPDGTVLYVAETRTRRVWRCEVHGPGRLGRVEGLLTVPSGGPLNVGGADGLCVDAAGRVIVATLGQGGITIYDPDGSPVGEWPMDDPLTTNAAISSDGEGLLVTLASSGRLVELAPYRDALVPQHN